ncbi:MAG: MBL fold metallo-hydrolase RNA specificity domain-containing protein [Thermoguttaceae bacterium]
MFVWNNGLVLSRAAVSVDFTRRQPCGFISHAHSDHIARHELSLCTPETAAFCQHRLKGKHRFKEMNYFQPIEWNGTKLTAIPAGHCLGSAMLLAEDTETGESLLYTGDFKLGPSATSVPAKPVYADYLVMECTFGTPKHRLPPREKIIDDFLLEIKRTFDYNRTPVVYAYSLGKSQEITKILTDAGFPVRQHKSIFEVSKIYESLGAKLGDFVELKEIIAENDRVLLVPPRVGMFETVTEPVTFAVTGWAIESGAKYKFGVDFAFPLSDHADYDDLIEMVRAVNPKTVYCTHGPDSFVDRLCDLGFDAKPLDKPFQKRLF